MPKPESKKIVVFCYHNFPVRFRIHATGIDQNATVRLSDYDKTLVTWSDPSNYVITSSTAQKPDGKIDFVATPTLVNPQPFDHHRKFDAGDGTLTMTVVNPDGSPDSTPKTLFVAYDQIV